MFQIPDEEEKPKERSVPVYQCQICKCTERFPCIDPEKMTTCTFVEVNLCSFCKDNLRQESLNKRVHKIFYSEYRKKKHEKKLE